jgi:2'-5' RNA ligase
VNAPPLEPREPAEAWRLFVAIRVPRTISEVVVAAAIADPRPGGRVRWVDPADLHVTVWFIGQVQASDVPALHDRLADVAAAASPFEVQMAGTGSFGRGAARATWVGLAGGGAGRIALLAEGLRAGPFHAHVTVCRGAPAAFAAALDERLGGAPALAWRATALELLRSHPGRRPAYQTVARFTFGEGRVTA